MTDKPKTHEKAFRVMLTAAEIDAVSVLLGHHGEVMRKNRIALPPALLEHALQAMLKMREAADQKPVIVLAR